MSGVRVWTCPAGGGLQKGIFRIELYQPGSTGTHYPADFPTKYQPIDVMLSGSEWSGCGVVLG